MLYDGVNNLVAENLDRLAREKVIPVFPTGVVDDPMHQSQEGELLLKGLRTIWDDHLANMARLRQILKYMVMFTLSTHFLFLDAAHRIGCTPAVPVCQKYGMLDVSSFSSTSFDLQYKTTL